jgi:hypothetical protein
LSISIISFFILTGCQPGLQSAKVVKNNSEMLYGEISLQQLYFDYPFWKETENNYNPNPEIAEKIQKQNNNVDILVFLGTWCGDSRRNVPKFFKSIQNNTNFNFKIWAVDRRKKLDNQLTEKYQIKRVPTFVFFKDNQEIGRIIENPSKTIEEDILDILNSI